MDDLQRIRERMAEAEERLDAIEHSHRKKTNALIDEEKDLMLLISNLQYAEAEILETGRTSMPIPGHRSGSRRRRVSPVAAALLAAVLVVAVAIGAVLLVLR